MHCMKRSCFPWYMPVSDTFTFTRTTKALNYVGKRSIPYGTYEYIYRKWQTICLRVCTLKWASTASFKSWALLNVSQCILPYLFGTIFSVVIRCRKNTQKKTNIKNQQQQKQQQRRPQQQNAFILMLMSLIVLFFLLM